MAKIRVYELAKELGLDNKEIMAKLRVLKIAVSSHMSVVPDQDLVRFRASIAEAASAPAPGGVDEKRVAKGVIRRRARQTAAPVSEEQPKVDVATLKHAAKRVRREGTEEPAVKHEPEILDGIPKEWSQESETPEKKKRARKKEEEVPAAPPPEPAETETTVAAEPEAPPASPAPPPEAVTPKPAAAPPRPPVKTAPAAVKLKTRGKTEPRPEAPTPEPAPVPAPAPEVPAEPAAPVARKMYIRPKIRRTARHVEGTPLPTKGKAAPKPADAAKAATPAATAAAQAEEDRKNKKKKKKKGKGDEVDAAPVVEEAAPKKRLRRKVAFKVQGGTEGMEIADAEQMYQPSRKKISAKKKATTKKTVLTTPKAAKRIVKMRETITVSELARQLGVKSQQVIKTLMADGIMASEDHRLDAATAGAIASAYNYEITQTVFDEDKVLGGDKAAGPENPRSRPPVVTVMGHVDHGKTSLLDTIRKTRVTEEEAGQITQHIGAYLVETSSGRITFIDTPGHEAFTSMRARGAKVTDIVVLVVAADDGIMPQTVEAANHAKAAGVPIIVAINKIDLPQANAQTVKQRLSEIGLTPEDWGGETLAVECSAKTGQGIPDLLEAILLQAEMLELNADPKAQGKGFVIESRLDKGRGPVATVIVQQGTLRRGDPIISGVSFGRIRGMLDDRGKPLTEAPPSTPVEIMGLSIVPEPGSEVVAVEDDKTAKLVAEHRRGLEQARAASGGGPSKVSLEDLMARLQEGEVQELNLVIKTDTHGSGEAIKQSVEKLSRKEVRVRVLHLGVGNITENDVLLAAASNAVIIGFSVKAEASARGLAEREGVQIRAYDIIYNLLDDVRASLLGMLKPVFEEKTIGKAEVRKVFRITKVGAVAGSYVQEGVIRRNARARVLREKEIVYTGKFKSLKRLQDDAREVAMGLECGIGLENFNDLQEGDVIEAFDVIELAQGL
jgi:translation initiation factor IF-2